MSAGAAGPWATPACRSRRSCRRCCPRSRWAGASTPTVWGRGYATEAATAALDQAFATLGLDQVCSLPQAANPASVRVAERLGLRAVRTLTIPATERRGAVEAVLFSVTAAEWRDR